MIRAFIAVVSLLFVYGCEGDFAGNRSPNIETFNGPAQMKVRSIGGVNHLIILSNNGPATASGGNIRFYTITDLSSPQLSSTVEPIAIPSNVNDFEIVDNKLYLLNRNEGIHAVWVYELSGTTYTRKLASNGTPLSISACTNPINVTQFQRTVGGQTYLAITCMKSGTVILFSPTTDSLVSPTDLGITPIDGLTFSDSSTVGARFYMTPRRTQDSSKDDRVNISFGRKIGIGIIGGAFLPSSASSDDLFVAMNLGQNALYSYRFSDFSNASNVVWDLTEYRSNKRISDTEVRRGTAESGFRGMAVDGNGNVFLSNRADNSVYRVPVSEITNAKDNSAGTNRNTKGFNENDRSYRIPADLDSITTDEDFPRLGELAVQNVTGQDASIVWVLGLDSAKIYRIAFNPAVNDLTVSSSISETVGVKPQGILGLPVGAAFTHIYVADQTTSRVYVLDATTLALIATLSQ